MVDHNDLLRMRPFNEHKVHICEVVKYVLNIYLVHNWDSLGFHLPDQQSRVHRPDPESVNLDWCDPEHVPRRGSGNLGCPDPDVGGETYPGRDLDV